jgi:hypothetical protein
MNFLIQKYNRITHKNVLLALQWIIIKRRPKKKAVRKKEINENSIKTR